MIHGKLKHMRPDSEIVKLVVAREQQIEYVNRCLAVHICPNCGSKLECEYVDLQSGGEEAEYKCSLCGSKYSQS